MNDKIVHAAPVPPFVTMVASAIPMVFDNSMSYYEALCALWKWLQDDVIKVINNNATVTEEYIALTKELKEYVENYFANLNVQEEINNKLDQMAEDGTLQEIITTYIQSNVAWTFDTVADMKLATNLVAGSYAQTLGFHTLNDGGGAIYKITDTGTANEMDVIAVGDLYANLIVNNGILNVKTLGAKSDESYDNTAVFNRALSFIDRYTIYFPYGFYRTSYLNNFTGVNSNIKIYGDNATIKLLDNVITADSQRLFSFSCANNVNMFIEMYGLNIDMNYTNNHSVIETTGDVWALQHCHAIFVLGSASSNIDVIFHDITFNDLIADGISLGGGSTQIVNRAIINNIISKNRTATRSDVCITCDFDSLNCSNMILDKFEIEVNSQRSNVKRTILLNNLDLSDTLDLDISNNDATNVLYANNIRVENYFNSYIGSAYYNNCTFKLSTFIRINDTHVEFNRCEFTTKNDSEFITYSEDYASYIQMTTRNISDVRFKNCNIKYNNLVLTSSSENEAHFLRGIDYKKIEFDGCNIDIPSPLLIYRGGETIINNCIFKTSNDYFREFCIYGSGSNLVESNVYLTNNKALSDKYLLMPPSSGQTVTIYENNPEWILGKVLSWTRFDKITSFNGGTGSIVTVKEFTEFLNNDAPNQGIWIKGQYVKSSIPTTYLGWVCTANGSFESGSQPTFTGITI